jgi:indolepyruvate ferredoxin oxidoreductase beta subunit
MADRPITILVSALGGEGGGVLSEWLFATAMRCGHSAQSTSVPGVAQRTGATTYYIEVFPQPDSVLGGRAPVFCLNPVPGAIDLLVSSELLETVRQIGAGMASSDRSTVISSSARALTVAEKMQLADGRLSDAALLATLQQHCRAAEVLDLASLAREAGTAISAVLLGAVAASGLLPFPRSAYEDSIRAGGKGVQASLRGFAAAFAAVQARRALFAAPPAPPQGPLLPEALRVRFPAPVHEFLALGHARLVAYQDAAYAQRYVERLERVLVAERAADPGAANGFVITRETARWLALH